MSVGHFARECAERKGDSTALVTKEQSQDFDDEEFSDAYDVALITVREKAFFSSTTILLDNESSLNVFNNSELLKNVREARKTVIMNGVQNGATGVTIHQEGDFNDIL